MRFLVVPVLIIPLALSLPAFGSKQDSKQSDSSSSSSSRNRKTPKASATESGLDAGGMVGAFYRNKTLGLSCKIPPGWVLRTEEMDARKEGSGSGKDLESKSSPQRPQSSTEDSGRVLLATFSRPPEATGEDVNGSILIAAEPVSAYPGLTEAVQYLGPLEEVAKAQGFTADEDAYEIAIAPKTLVREDFHKDVGSRVMRQSTLVFLAKGYAVSITVIAGTDDDVEDLVDGLSFAGK